MKFLNYIDSFINESINDKGIFKAIFVCGSPGAGKSYTISKLTSGSISPRVVNTDRYTEYFGKGFNLSAEQWSYYSSKIKELNINQLTHYINSMLPLWIDSTSSNPQNTLKRIGILESYGYDTACVWINTSLETSLRRNSQRKRQVPENFIKETYEKIQKLKPFYKNKFSHFWEVNNDDGELTNEVILSAFKVVTKFYSSPLENPIGQMFIDELKKGKGKYLNDIEFWKSQVTFNDQLSGWFK